MAGSFGFEKDKYEVSVKCGEHALLPKVRGASPETLIVASGFSCQEQIAQLTDRRALHLAHVLQMALRQTQENGAMGVYPEKRVVKDRDHAVRRSMMKAGASVGGAIAAGATALWLARHEPNQVRRTG
jgi:hypothetical protein